MGNRHVFKVIISGRSQSFFFEEGVVTSCTFPKSLFIFGVIFFMQHSLKQQYFVPLIWRIIYHCVLPPAIPLVEKGLASGTPVHNPVDFTIILLKIPINNNKRFLWYLILIQVDWQLVKLHHPSKHFGWHWQIFGSSVHSRQHIVTADTGWDLRSHHAGDTIATLNVLFYVKIRSRLVWCVLRVIF